MGRGAAGAEGVGFGKVVSSSPIGVWCGEGVVPHPHNFFNFMAQNSAFWHLF